MRFRGSILQALLFETAIRDDEALRSLLDEDRIRGTIRDSNSSELHGLLRSDPSPLGRRFDHEQTDALAVQKTAYGR